MESKKSLRGSFSEVYKSEREGRQNSREVHNRKRGMQLIINYFIKEFNYIANSDFHEEKHLRSWKTLLRCSKNVEAVKQAIRTNEAVALFLYRGGKLK